MRLLSHATGGSKSRSGNLTNRRLILLCGIIPVLVAAGLALFRPDSVASLDNAAYDTLLRWAKTKPPSDRVVIIDVDERSLSTVGQWPWRRDLFGRLIRRLREEGAAVIALDIIFAEPDRDQSLGETHRSPDAELAQSLSEGRVVLGYAFTFDSLRGTPDRCVLHPLSLAVLQPSQDTGGTPFFHAGGTICALPALAQAAGASGFLNAAPDTDGILRRVPVLVEADGPVYPSLALSAVVAATRARDVTLRVSHLNASTLIVDSRSIPLDGKSNLLLRFRGKKQTFPYVSAADVLSGHVPEGKLRDKIVFVGTTALGTREVVATPVDTLFAGVEVQATVADNLLEQDFIRRPQLATTIESQITVVLGIAIAVLVARAGLFWGAVGGGGSLAALWLGTGWLLSSKGVFVSPLFATLGLVPALPVMTLAKFVIEQRRADRAGTEKTTAQRFMLKTLLSLTEVRDAETGRHSRRTQQYAKVLAQQLARHPDFHDYLTPERIELLSNLAPLHDIGKVGVPDQVLNKPGALTPEELEEMRKHPTHGRDVILKAERDVGVYDDAILGLAKDIVYTHHERWDGNGYPQRLRGRDIPVAGRLMAIVDVYDAAVSRALYRQPISHEAAVAFITNGAGTQFDPAVVQAFLSVAAAFKSVSEESKHPART
jgi:HD-GYP domain-containing protein (c-di-GMP phosphodiesterase class II)